MKKVISIFTAGILLFTLAPSVALAARVGGSTEPVGYDISWPQCGTRLPTGQAFGIVGLNNGNAASTNPCLAQQLTWASKSVGGSSQPKVQVYVNTANPGEVISQITTWPTNNTDKTSYTTINPYGACLGANDDACSWQYGWNRSVEDVVDRFKPAAQQAGIDGSTSAYTWWLDVETMNTWQSTPEGQARNSKALEGMTAYFNSQGAKVGLYSTAEQWNVINGSSISTNSNLNNLPNWRPSGTNLNNALANCAAVSLTPGGFVSLTQYIQKNLDKNHSCI